MQPRSLTRLSWSFGGEWPTGVAYSYAHFSLDATPQLSNTYAPSGSDPLLWGKVWERSGVRMCDRHSSLSAWGAV
jgi:hypothetical protein